VLAYTGTDVDAPVTWFESDAKLISNPQMVKLHSFDTKVIDSASLCCLDTIFCLLFGLLRACSCDGWQIHKVETLVSYKKDEWDE
jgi:mitotic spindle assembly checkpoint protein MAD2